MYYTISSYIILIVIHLMQFCSFTKNIKCKIINSCNNQPSFLVRNQIYPHSPKDFKVKLKQYRNTFGDLEPYVIFTWSIYNSNNNMSELSAFRLSIMPLTYEPGRSQCFTFKLNYTRPMENNTRFKFQYRYKAMPSMKYSARVDSLPLDLLSSKIDKPLIFKTDDILIFISSSNWKSENINITKLEDNRTLHIQFQKAPDHYGFKEYEVRLLSQDFKLIKEKIVYIKDENKNDGDITFDDICSGYYFISIRPISLMKMIPNKCVCLNSHNNCVQECSVSLSKMIEFNSTNKCEYKKLYIAQDVMKIKSTYFQSLLFIIISILGGVFIVCTSILIYSKIKHTRKENLILSETYPFPDNTQSIYETAIDFNNNKAWK